MDTVGLDNVEINLLRSPQSFENMLLRCGYRNILLRCGYKKCTGHEKVDPRLPATWDKALDFYRFDKSANIRLQLIYPTSHSSIGTYHGLRSGSNSIIISNVGSL